MSNDLHSVEEKEMTLLALLLDSDDDEPELAFELDLGWFREGPPRKLLEWVRDRLSSGLAPSRSGFNAPSVDSVEYELAPFVRSLPTDLPDVPLSDVIFDFLRATENAALQRIFQRMEDHAPLGPMEARQYLRMANVRLDRLRRVLSGSASRTGSLMPMRERLWSVFEALDRGEWHDRLTDGLQLMGFEGVGGKIPRPGFFIVEGCGRGTKFCERYADLVALKLLEGGKDQVLMYQEDAVFRDERVLAAAARLSIHALFSDPEPRTKTRDAIASGLAAIHRTELVIKAIPGEVSQIVEALYRDITHPSTGLVVVQGVGWRAMSADPGARRFIASLREFSRDARVNLILVLDRDEGPMGDTGALRSFRSFVKPDAPPTMEWKTLRRVAAEYADVVVRVGVRSGTAGEEGPTPGLRLVKSPFGGQGWREAPWMLDPALPIPG